MSRIFWTTEKNIPGAPIKRLLDGFGLWLGGDKNPAPEAYRPM